MPGGARDTEAGERRARSGSPGRATSLPRADRGQAAAAAGAALSVVELEVALVRERHLETELPISGGRLDRSFQLRSSTSN